MLSFQVYKHILGMICMFSHWVEAFPCRRATALTVAFPLCPSPPSSGLVERTNGIIKIQLAKISEAFNLLWTKALPIVLLNLRSFGKHKLSPYEIVTGCLMHLDEGAYEPTLLKGDILHYCQGLINQSKEIDKLRRSRLFKDEKQLRLFEDEKSLTTEADSYPKTTSTRP
ncbi:hypothetical protein QTO34_015456, partial [Cnephaeus nilssonii]